MAIDPALAALAPHTVQIAPRSGQNEFGEDTFGADVAYSCLIEKKPRMVRTATGEEAVSGATIYLTSAPSLTVDDKVTLSDGTQPAILSIGTYPNTSGDYFSVIYLQ